jgi:hypothetical protein
MTAEYATATTSIATAVIAPPKVIQRCGGPMNLDTF